MALVNFVRGTAADFAALGTKSADTLYFISDERRLYLGSTPYSGGIYKQVDTLPTVETAEVNVLYIVGSNADNVQYFDGTKFVQVVKPNSTAADLAALTNRVTTAEGEIDTLQADMTATQDALATIQGTGDGSISKAQSDAVQEANKHTDDIYTTVDTQISNLNTDLGNLTSIVTYKADAATTLEGYNIGDAYTMAQTDDAIARAIAGADHLKREIVDTMPSVSEADPNTIYMVPKVNGLGVQQYDEYMVINSNIEKIGDSAVDLTNYATKDEVSTAKSEAITEATTTAAADATSKANAAQSAAEATAAADATTKANAAQTAATTAAAADATSKANQALTDAKAYTDAEVGKISVPDVSAFITASDITEGTANGTIAVEGTNVAVHGLGSAAYAASSAFDPAGSANTALASARTYADGLATNYATAAQGTNADNALSTANQLLAALTWQEL